MRDCVTFYLINQNQKCFCKLDETFPFGNSYQQSLAEGDRKYCAKKFINLRDKVLIVQLFIVVDNSK